MDHDDEAVFGLRFQPRHGAGDTHILPAVNLVQALEGLQRTIHLVAMMKGRKEIRRRARISRDIESRFQLHCRTATDGSYYQHTFIASKDVSLLIRDEIREVAKATRDLLGAVNTGDVHLFNESVVDSAFRAPILAALDGMFERQGSNYLLSVEDGQGAVIADSRAVSESLPRMKERRLPLNMQMIVTGFFNKIDFKEHKLWLLMPETGRIVECIYDEDVEQTLLENARDLIQVVGTIEVDENGNPRRVTDIQEIHSVNRDDLDMVDILPANLEAIVHDGHDGLKIKVSLTDDAQAYCAEVPELGIDLAAHTRIELIDAVSAELGFLWENIARERDDNLTLGARSLKARLHQYFREVAA